MKHLKTFESFKKEIVREHSGLEEDKIELPSGHSLVLWHDEDQEDWNVALMPEEEGEHGITFAWKDEKGVVEVRDHGLIQGQYLSDDEKKLLSDFGLKVGEKFVSMADFWKHCKKLASKKK